MNNENNNLNNQQTQINQDNNMNQPQLNQYTNTNQYFQQPMSNQNNINSSQFNQMQNNIPSQQFTQQTFNQVHPNLKNKKIRLKWIFIPLIILIFIIAFIFIYNSKKNITRTFMIYMVGADLESNNGMATYELNGIDPKLVDLKNVNVVLIAGGSTIWNNSYIEKDETSIYELTENGFKKVKKQSIKNMGDSNLLSDFLKYAYQNYKSDEYNLLFWNHGGAIDGSEYDEISNDNLSLIELSSALSNSPFSKNRKMGSIIFGTCLNGSIEMANVFKNYAHYFIASEEVSMSVENTSDFSFINDIKISDHGTVIGEKFISKYKDKINKLKAIYNENYNIYSTYSIVDLNNINDLNKSLDAFFKEIDLVKNYNMIAKVRSNLYQYAYNQSGDPSYDMVDLYNLINSLKNLAPKKADNALQKLESTVIYNYATNSSSRGISIYFPYNGIERLQDSFLSSYDKISPIKKYNTFITDFKSLRTTNAVNKLSFKGNNSTINKNDKEADFELELTDDQVNNYAKSNYIVFRDNKDGYYLPVYSGKEVTLDGSKLKAKIKDRQLKIGDSSYKRIITLIEDDVTDRYINYSTYGVLNDRSSNEIYEWKSDRVKISFTLDRKTNKVQISQVLLINKNNLPSSVNLDIKKYDNLELGSSSYKIINEDGSFNENWNTTSNRIFEGIDIKPKESFDIELEDYQDGYDYYCIFKIYDVNNNYYYSNLVKMD